MVEAIGTKPTIDIDTKAITLSKEGQLTLPASQAAMVLSVPGLAAASAYLNPRAVAGLLKDDPQAVEKLLEATRVFPGLFISREQISSRLGDIRQNYPDIIKFLTEERMGNLLKQYPAVQARVDEDRELLQDLPDDQQVQTSELVLRILIGSAVIRDLSPQTFSGIITAHRLYIDCLELFEEKDNHAEVDRDLDRFVAVGQRLGVLRRITDPAFPEEVRQAQEYNNKRQTRQEENSGPDLNETIKVQREIETVRAKRAALQALIKMCQGEPIANSLKKQLASLGENPSKSLKNLEEPGQPDFTKAEIVHHHGYE